MDEEATTSSGAAARCSAKKVKTVAGSSPLGLSCSPFSSSPSIPPATGSSTDRLKLVCAVIVLGLAFVGSLAAYLVCYHVRPYDQVNSVMPNIISDRSLVTRPPPLA